MRLRGIEVDVSRYPLVVVRYGHQITDAEWSACAARIGELIRRGPFGMINDVRSGSVPSAVQRRTIITLYDENDRDVRAHFLASALVGESILLRGVLTALTWVRPAPHPMAIFATLPFVLGAAANVAGGYLTDAGVRKLGLRRGRTLIGTVCLATAAGRTGLVAGSYSFTAVVNDYLRGLPASNAVSFNVSAASPPPGGQAVPAGAAR